MFRLAIADTPGSQSIIGRRTSATVQESAILRFLNRLSGTAMGDFVGKAEMEENRFAAEVFNALMAKNFPVSLNPGSGANIFRIQSTQSGARTAQLVFRVSW